MSQNSRPADFIKALAGLSLIAVVGGIALKAKPGRELSADERQTCQQLTDRTLRERAVDVYNIQPYDDFESCRAYTLRHSPN